MTKSQGAISTREVLAATKKDYGANVGHFGDLVVQSDRIPTGIFPFDLAIGGGFPRGRLSIIYGQESSNKTNLALKAIASHQALWPKETCIFFDIENSFNGEWAARLGVQVDKLLVLKPDYAEQAVDMVESFIQAEDCGLVVLDSIAALVTTLEAESSADKAVVGGNSIVVGKLVRKATLGFNQANKEGRSPSLICINQTRFKVAVMFGDPETMPGGNAPIFASQLTIRVYGKNVIDTKVSKVMPMSKNVTFQVKKWKVPIVAANGTFEMVTYGHEGLLPGDANDWNTVSQYLKDYGLLVKKEKGQGWLLDGEEYATLQVLRDRLIEDKPFGMKTRQAIVELTMGGGVVESKEAG